MSDFAPRVRTRTPVGEFSRTKQAFKDESDINLIVKGHAQSGIVPNFNKKDPSFGDFSEGVDLFTAMNRVREANEEFATLPAAARAAAQNDPVVMLNMLQNEQGANDLVDAGLDYDLPQEWVREVVEPTEPPVVVPPAREVPVIAGGSEPS